MKGLSILGSTGSIGTNVLRVVDAFPGRFEVVGLAAGGNVEVLAEQVARHRPRIVSVAEPGALERLSRLVDLSGLRAVVGREGMVEVATRDEVRMVVASAVGAVGLVPTYRALEAGKDVALANKETLVMAGELMLARARETGARRTCGGSSSPPPGGPSATARSRASPASPGRRPSPIPRGAWGRRSRSTPPPS
jgi:1-deoxy-D-xylulose-5-phosphate reductoisomerase